MPLDPGTTLGPYRVTAKIGEGGMGEVYRARDTKLDRDVALKVLPQAFTDDPDRLARFEREAKVLASLNHPNIGGIHGLEESEGIKALVLEYIEGPTLAERIKQGPIPVDEALPIAKQIAEALEAAHEAGVIHRDLKPANIKVREDGTVKVLDFGLAKALDPNPDSDPSQSPTLTAAATQMGMIMGTAAYMSPEQARGKAVDRRVDIWSFGAVLFEMLTGTRAFAGADVSLTLAKVLEREPLWDLLPDTTSPSLRNLLERCLEKEPRQRVQAVGDVRLAMEGAFETVSAANAGAPPYAGLGRVISLKLAVLAVIGALVVGTLATWWVMGPSPPARESPTRLEVRLGGLGTDERVVEAVLSPDGTQLVYGVVEGFVSGALYVRALDDLEGTLLVPSGAYAPFFSPDGQWVGFFTAAELQKVPVTGGTPQTDFADTGASGGVQP